MFSEKLPISPLYIMWNSNSNIHHIWTNFFFSDDDSDVDLVTDFLSSNIKHAAETTNHCSLKQRQPKQLLVNCSSRPEQNNFHQQQQLNATNTASNNTISGNMVPIISVTPHSPGTKYNSILGMYYKIWKFLNLTMIWVIIAIFNRGFILIIQITIKYYNNK